MVYLFDTSFFNSLFANILAALIVTFLFFLIKEKVFKKPNLNGIFYLKQITKETTYNPYINMELQYTLSLIIEGNKILGSSEKTYENSSIGMNKEHIIHYTGKERSICRIEGIIQKRYLSLYDLLIFHSFEENECRKSTTFYSIKIYREHLLFGKPIFKNGFFKSTIASQTGYIEISYNEFEKKEISIT